MAVVKRIDPRSAFKMGLALYASLGLLLGLLCAIASVLVSALPGEVLPGTVSARIALGLGAIVFFPLTYGLLGGAFAAIGAAIYNLAARWVGGLEIEVN